MDGHDWQAEKFGLHYVGWGEARTIFEQRDAYFRKLRAVSKKEVWGEDWSEPLDEHLVRALLPAEGQEGSSDKVLG